MKKYSKLEMYNWISSSDENNDEFNYNSIYMYNTINLSSYKNVENNKTTRDRVHRVEDSTMDDILHDIYIEIIKDLFNQLTPS